MRFRGPGRAGSVFFGGRDGPVAPAGSIFFAGTGRNRHPVPAKPRTTGPETLRVLFKLKNPEIIKKVGFMGKWKASDVRAYNIFSNLAGCVLNVVTSSITPCIQCLFRSSKPNVVLQSVVFPPWWPHPVSLVPTTVSLRVWTSRATVSRTTHWGYVSPTTGVTGYVFSALTA